MTYLYPKPKDRDPVLLSLLLGLSIALLIFLLVPLTQRWQAPQQPPTDTIEALMPAMLPLPSDRLPVPPHLPEPTQNTAPKWNAPLPLPQLKPLDLSLNPGIGKDSTIDDGLALNLELESAPEWISRYQFDDLDTTPHIKRQGHIQYPMQLQRRQVEGFVQLLVFINPGGRVEVQEVLNYSHQAFVAPAVAGATATRFSPPTRGGQAVNAQYSWRIEFSLAGRL